MNYVEALQKRYSVKKFDAQRKVSSKILKKILQAAQLSASSLGVQPYEILVIESKEVKSKLIPAFYNPSQISTCSHLLVILSKKNLEEAYINSYFQHISSVRDISLEKLQPFRETIQHHVESLNEQQIHHWAEKQAYIVLGNLLFATALEKVDTCPIEGFDQKKIEEILEIDSKNLSVTVTIALGYRAEDDVFQNFKKVRKPEDKLFKFL